MRILTRDDLGELVEGSEGLCVSIYMPTERAGKEVEQNPIRLKNLLTDAEERLTERDLRTPEARALLEPAQMLLRDSTFWQRQSDGLALFVSSNMLRHYRVPFDFKELLVVGDRFHVKPLLPLLSGDGRFYILALSQSEIRLLQGTRYSISEIDLEDVPKNLVEILEWDDPEKRLQFHTATRTPGGERVQPAMRSARPAVFHGHGVASADDPKDYISRFFRRVDEGLGEILDDEKTPLVLAGVDYLHPIYREASTYPYLVAGGIGGNPEELSADELHRRAWSIVHPLFLAEQEDAAAQYRQLAGAGSERASGDLSQVIPAAYHGRVETLFVATHLQRWGVFDPDANEIELHKEARPGDEDLLDLAAVHTLLNGGTVYAVEPQRLPGETALAAVFRY
jgi:hypothetical protein